MNDNEGDGIANDSNNSNDGQQDALQDPGYHQELLLPDIPQRSFRSVLHSLQSVEIVGNPSANTLLCEISEVFKSQIPLSAEACLRLTQ